MTIIGRRKWRKPNGRQTYHHMLADSKQELHTTARKAGIHRCWYSTKPVPHYDVPTDQFYLVVALGIKVVGNREEAEMVRRLRLKYD